MACSIDASVKAGLARQPSRLDRFDSEVHFSWKLGPFSPDGFRRKWFQFSQGNGIQHRRFGPTLRARGWLHSAWRHRAGFCSAAFERIGTYKRARPIFWSQLSDETPLDLRVVPVSFGSGRAVAGNLGRFNEKHFQEFVPELFRWTDCMSRPGTKFSISENVSR